MEDIRYLIIMRYEFQLFILYITLTHYDFIAYDCR